MDATTKAFLDYGALGLVLLVMLAERYQFTRVWLPKLYENHRAEIKQQRDDFLIALDKIEARHSVAMEHVCQRLDAIDLDLDSLRTVVGPELTFGKERAA